MAKVPDGGSPVASQTTSSRSVPVVSSGDEPIELLVQLAERGEINPWDIDIVQVTDKFLEHLDSSDLRNSARALFYASVLLRMKSDELLVSEQEPEDPPPDELEPWDDPGTLPLDDDPIASLESELSRRLDRKRARGTPETLDELVHELRDAERESWWKESRTYDTSMSPRGFRRGTQTLDYHDTDEFRQADEPTEDDVTRTAHAEDIETTIARVREMLETQYDAGRKEVLFREIEDAGGSRVQTYLGLLFLTHRGIVRLEQDEIFGDLWIVQL